MLGFAKWQKKQLFTAVISAPDYPRLCWRVAQVYLDKDWALSERSEFCPIPS
jgi:hypothetical protein